MHRDIVVVGAGPAGLLTTLNIRNHDVLVLEEHGKPGIPKHCAGVVGKFVALESLRLSRKLIDSSYREITFITGREKYSIGFREPIAFHINRPLLEEVLAEKVESMGHRILYDKKARPLGTGSVKSGNDVIEYGVLVVSEGALGIFRKTLLGGEIDFLNGVQVLVKVNNVKHDTLVIIFSDLTPHFFSWVIPLDVDIAILGLASRKPRIDLFMKHVEKILDVKVISILEYFGGLIPLYRTLKNPVHGEKIVFHGDAVPLTKPYTSGGLYYVFKLSPILAKLIDMGKLIEYTSYYKRLFYVRNLVEKVIVGLFRKTRYYIPVKIIRGLWNLGLIDYSDFDEHVKLFFKSIPVTPLLPFSTLL